MTGRRVPFAIVAAAVLVAAGTVYAVNRQEGAASEVVPADPDAVYDPVAAGEPLPDGYRIGLARDAIEPVYNPEFTAADRVDWPDEMLVIGVAEGDEAKAYPVTHLNSHEMVIDSLAGIPILVTW